MFRLHCFSRALILLIVLLGLHITGPVALSNTSVKSPAGSETDSPGALYASLVESIETAQGRVILYMNGGCWKTDVDGSPVIWRVQPNTKGEIKFDYRNGVLASASVKFIPAIEIKVPTVMANGQMLWNRVEEVSYGDDGDVTSPGLLVNNSTFQMSPTPAELFFGQPFHNIKTVYTVGPGGNCDNPQAPSVDGMFQRIEFQKNASGDPGLRVALKPTKLTFAMRQANNPQARDIFINVARPSGFEFDSIKYNVRTRALTATLNDLKLTVTGGHIDAGRLILSLGGSSQLAFNDVKIERMLGGTSSVISRNGVLSASLGKGSQVTFAQNDINPTEFTFNEGHVNLNGFSMEANDAAPTKVTVSQTSTLNIQIFTGRVGIGPQGSVTVGQGGITAAVTGTWQVGSRPDLRGDISSLDIQVIAGQIAFTDADKITLDRGVIKSTKLKLNSLQVPAVTGPFDLVSISGAENENLKLLEGVTVRTSGLVRIIADDPVQPLTILPDKKYPVGRYRLALPYSSLDMNGASISPELHLVNGRLDLRLLNREIAAAGGPVHVFEAESLFFDGDIDRADLSFGQFGAVNLRGVKSVTGAKNISLLLKGEWQVGKKPAVSGEISRLEALISGGNLVPTNESHLKITGGAIEATRLKVNSNASRVVTGSVDRILVDIGRDSYFTVPGGVRFVTNDTTGAFEAKDTQAPLTIPSSGPPFYGAFTLRMNLQNTKFDGMTLKSGEAELPLIAKQDGSLSGNHILITASAGIKGPGGGIVPLKVQLSNGDLNYNFGQTPTMNADLTAQTLGSISIPVETPPINGIPDHDDFRIFKIKTTLKTGTFELPTTKVNFTGRRFKFETSEIKIPLTIIIPGGMGEHPNSDVNEEGNHGGQDWAQHWQEVFTDTYPGCRLHVYIEPQEIGITPSLKVKFDGQTMNVQLMKMELLNQPKWRDDGCTGLLKSIIAGLAFVVTTTITGNPAIGVVAGAAALAKTDDLLDHLRANLNIKLIERVQGFSHNWEFEP